MLNLYTQGILPITITIPSPSTQNNLHQHKIEFLIAKKITNNLIYRFPISAIRKG